MSDDAPTHWYAKPWLRRWLKRSGIAAAALFLVYVIGGFIGVPLVLKHVVLAKVDHKIIGSLETGSVRFNPFTWALEIHDFEGLTSDGDVAVSFTKFRINFQPTSLFSDEMVVRELLLEQPKGVVHLNSDGELNLLSLFGLNEPKPEDPDAEPTVIPSLLIETLEVRGAAVELNIETFDPPFGRNMQDISFVMKDVRSQASHDNPYELLLVSDEGEKITVAGKLRLDPLSSTGSVNLMQVQLPDFTSFGSSVLDARIGSGSLDLSFDYRFEPLAAEPEFGILNGQLAVKEFDLRQDDEDQAIQRIGSLQVADFYLDIARRQAGIKSVEIDQALLTLVRDASGLHLAGQTSTRQDKPNGAPSSPAEASDDEIVTGLISDDHDIGEALTEASRKLRQLSGNTQDSDGASLLIEVGDIKVRNTDLRLLDQSVSPTASIGLNQMSIEVGPYLSDGSKNLDLDLSASMAGKGEISVRGNISAHDFPKATALDVQLNDIPMAKFGPYARPAIGRAPTGGSLSANLGYTIRNGLMEGSNELTIQGIKLGPQSEAKDAPKLPMDLAIAILEDTQGTIEIDLPVKGDLNHPEFSYGRIVSRAIGNVITKVATAPFRMLGNLLPDGDAFEEDFISFKPGEASLSAEGKKMTKAIAKVMEARPRIGLAMHGGYTTDQDTKALADKAFEKQVAELTDKGKSRQDAIKSLYKDLPKDQREKGWRLPKPDVMEADVRKAIKISKDDLVDLANRRAKVVMASLEGSVADRAKLKPSKESGSPRVELTFDIRD